MRYKYVIPLLVMVGIGWVVWLRWAKPVQTESMTMQNDSVGSIEVVDSIDLPTDVNSEPKQETVAFDSKPSLKDQSVELDQFVAQFDERRYSDDLQVEVSSVFFEHTQCRNNILGWNFKGTELNAQQIALKNDLEAFCADLQEQYPMLRTNHQKKIRDTFFAKKPQQGLAFLMNRITRDLPSREYNQRMLDLIQESHRQRNGQFLTMIHSAKGYRFESLLFETQWLEGGDVYYLHQLREIALVKLSCAFQSGITCSPIGNFMLQQCSMDIESCGMKFSDWYDHYLTNAMKADVELLMALYQS